MASRIIHRFNNLTVSEQEKFVTMLLLAKGDTSKLPKVLRDSDLMDEIGELEKEIIVNPVLKPGMWVEQNLNYYYPEDGKVYTCQQDHRFLGHFPPSTTPALFWHTPLPLPGEPYGRWVQPAGGVGAYSIGKRVFHKEKSWESKINENGFEPGATGIGSNIWQEIK
jgi:hypothetical protein